MNRFHIPIYFILYLLLICSRCETIQVLTAVNHKPEMETPESIRHFAKKHNIDGHPILRFDNTILSMESAEMATFLMYNHNGHYLSLRDTAQGCPDKKQNFTAMKFILEHDDDHFINDSMMMMSASLKDTTMELNMKDLKKMNGFPEDTTVWVIQKETYTTHLDKYVPYFRTLEGDVVDIYSLYSDYLIFYSYQMSGKSKLDCILIREKIKEIEKLNKEFGPRIHLVLVNLDEMEGNTLSANTP